jgi:hypothetical protein
MKITIEDERVGLQMSFKFNEDQKRNQAMVKAAMDLCDHLNPDEFEIIFLKKEMIFQYFFLILNTNDEDDDDDEDDFSDLSDNTDTCISFGGLETNN